MNSEFFIFGMSSHENCLQMKSSNEISKKDKKLSSDGIVYIYTIHVKMNVEDSEDDLSSHDFF